MFLFVFLNRLLDYSGTPGRHRAIKFSSRIGLSIWKALKKNGDQLQPNNSDAKKNKIKANRILFCFIAIVYLLRTNISEELNIDWLFLPGLG